jgi:hypothetical protein
MEKYLSTPFLYNKINNLNLSLSPRGSKTSLQAYFNPPVGKLLVSFCKPVPYDSHSAPITRLHQCIHCPPNYQ